MKYFVYQLSINLLLIILIFFNNHPSSISRSRTGRTALLSLVGHPKTPGQLILTADRPNKAPPETCLWCPKKWPHNQVTSSKAFGLYVFPINSFHKTNHRKEQSCPSKPTRPITGTGSTTKDVEAGEKLKGKIILRHCGCNPDESAFHRELCEVLPSLGK